MIEIDALPLAYRCALTDPRRGPLEWRVVDSHHAPSYCAELWYWAHHVRGVVLTRGEGALDTLPADRETRSLFKHLTSVQPHLLRARSLEVSLGVRWTRPSLVASIRGGSLRGDVAAAYSYSLLYVYLDRVRVVSRWGAPPPSWRPPELSDG